jgi:radical SAM protein with 4Fe4S-binding SPASM domain
MQLRKIMAIAKKLDVEYVQFKNLRNHPDELGVHEIRIAKTLIAEWKKDFESKNIQGFKVFDSLQYGTAMTPWRAGKIHCMSSMMHTSIDTDGDVHVCCYFAHRKDSIKIGNVFEQPFRDIWGGIEHKRVLSTLDTRECSAYDCRFCTYDQIFKGVIHSDLCHIDFI